MSLLCIPLKERSIETLGKKVERADQIADIIEVWLDQLDPAVPVSRLRGMTEKPLIYVNKGAAERGSWKGSEIERITRLMEAIESGASYVDVSIDTDKELLDVIMKATHGRVKTILSYHNFYNTPDKLTLRKKIEKAYGMGANVVKIATFAERQEDNLTILALVAEYRAKMEPIIGLCMGRIGRPSRILAQNFGSYLTYVALDEESKTADGQLTYDQYTSLLPHLII
jgi:3-dehydroquinate dehydratase / shikimate dehydrogenase